MGCFSYFCGGICNLFRFKDNSPPSSPYNTYSTNRSYNSTDSSYSNDRSYNTDKSQNCLRRTQNIPKQTVVHSPIIKQISIRQNTPEQTVLRSPIIKQISIRQNAPEQTIDNSSIIKQIRIRQNTPKKTVLRSPIIKQISIRQTSTPSLTGYAVQVLDEILKLDPLWLVSKTETNNEVNNDILPMLNTFASFDEYKRRFYPLMKMELMESIRSDYKKLKPKFFVFNLTNCIDSANECSFNCKVLSGIVPESNTGDLAIAVTNFSLQFFVYIKLVRTRGEFLYIVFESSVSNITRACINLKIKRITSIGAFLGAFNAVDTLNKSLYFMELLDPKIICKENNVALINAEYVGYDKLNEEQNKILLNIYRNLGQTKISLVEGPPGTGKSRLIANLALQVLYGKNTRNRKILICASSNMTVDNIACKLLDIRKNSQYNKMKLLRFGDSEKIHPNVLHITLKKLVAFKFTPGKGKSRNEIAHHLVRTVDIIFATLSGCVNLLDYTKHFDICIIDEATQCLEPFTLIPLQFGIKSLVLVGDSKQLSGTVLSQTASKYGYGTSLYTRIENCYKVNFSDNFYMLKTQYRMHPNICSWPSKYFYKNSLVSDESTSKHRIPIKPYSILSLDYYQNESDNECKIFNSLEAEFVCTLIKNLYKLMPSSEEFTYGIITPYAEQRDILNKLLKSEGIKNISAESVDSYQGQERDVIIISNTRTKGVGFFKNEERLNVALARARKSLILCGNFCSLQRVPLWRSLLNDAKRRCLMYHIKPMDVNDFDKNVMSYLKA